MKFNKLCKGLYHIKFQNQYSVTSTFMRLQEFYESDIAAVKGNHITLEEFMDQYAKKNGNFTYTTDWYGFNVPSEIVEKFFQYIDTPLVFEYLEKEQDLYDAIKQGVDKEDEKYYLIGTFDDGDIIHEVAHGLYYLDKNYKEEMDVITKNLKERHALRGCLMASGYCEEVVDDEIQAYLSTSKDIKELKTWLHKATKFKIPKEYNKVLKKYLKRYKIKINGNL